MTVKGLRLNTNKTEVMAYLGINLSQDGRMMNASCQAAYNLAGVIARVWKILF